MVQVTNMRTFSRCEINDAKLQKGDDFSLSSPGNVTAEMALAKNCTCPICNVLMRLHVTKMRLRDVDFELLRAPLGCKS